MSKGSYVIVNPDPEIGSNGGGQVFAPDGGDGISRPESAEDNLSHESYELIEKVDPENDSERINQIVGGVDEVDNVQPKHQQLQGPSGGSRKGSSHFEQEFFRQAATENQEQPMINQVQPAKDGDSLSSKLSSSRCSLNTSSILSPPLAGPKNPDNTRQIIQNQQPQVQPQPSAVSSVPDVVQASALPQASSVATNPVPPVPLPRRAPSQDSFSQASNHGVTPTPPPGILHQNSAQQDTSSKASDQPDEDFSGHEVNLNRVPQTAEERLLVDIVRKRGGGGLVMPTSRQQQQATSQRQYHYHTGTAAAMHFQELNNPDLHHSLPRQMFAEPLQLQQPHLHQPQEQPPQSKVRFVSPTYQPETKFSSRTLPNSRGRGRGMAEKHQHHGSAMGGGGTPFYPGRRSQQPGECSSGSSSSHASPRIVRPNSLEFNLQMAGSGASGVGGNISSGEMPSIMASRPKPPVYQHPPPYVLQQQLHPHAAQHQQQLGAAADLDDSSSAISFAGLNSNAEQLPYATSSSDVPQTPENPNTNLIDSLMMKNKKKLYYSEERIYDVPEGIEGVTDLQHSVMAAQKAAAAAAAKQQLHLSKPQEPADITSPSSSSGIADPFPAPRMSLLNQTPPSGRAGKPPPTTAPPPGI